MKHIILILLTYASFIGFAQPELTVNDTIEIRKVMDIPASTATRIVVHPNTKEIYYAAVAGEIYKVDPVKGTKSQVFSAADHGLKEVYGFDIGKSGNIYLVSMTPGSTKNEAIIKKYDGSKWTTMVTASYNQSSYQHRFNAVLESPDQQYIVVNSGANTDHGEAHSGQRDYPFTAVLLKFPINTENLVLKDDETFMKPYIFAKGLRNTYDLAYDANGELFGVENGPQGDHHEELNWIQEGKHYGFPWRMGVYDNPQQFSDYDPNKDYLLLSNGIASIHKNDPTFPPVPTGVTFVEPVLNKGPHQDKYRDPVDGLIKDASDEGAPMGSFTPHSSPVGLMFDVTDSLPGDYMGKAFCVNWSAAGDRKIKPFGATVEDLLMIDLTKVGDNFEASMTRVAKGFNHPVDAALVGNKMYVIEHGTGSALWELTFVRPTVPEVKEVLTIEDQLLAGINVYPNSFKSSVKIDLNVKQSGKAALEVYSLDGRKVKNLWSGQYNSGQKVQIGWDGKDKHGAEMSSGVYLIKFSIGDHSVNTRLLKIE